MIYGRTAASPQNTISTTDKANGLSGVTFLSRQTFVRPIAMSLASRISVSPHPNKPFTFIPHHVWVPPGARSIYGGLVISQALCSSLLTVNLLSAYIAFIATSYILDCQTEISNIGWISLLRGRGTPAGK